MDNLYVNLDMSGDKPGVFCVTTSYSGETLDEVVSFAFNWNCDREQVCDVKVKEI